MTILTIMPKTGSESGDEGDESVSEMMMPWRRPRLSCSSALLQTCSSSSNSGLPTPTLAVTASSWSATRTLPMRSGDRPVKVHASLPLLLSSWLSLLTSARGEAFNCTCSG